MADRRTTTRPPTSAGGDGTTDVPLEQLALSVRVYNALVRRGIGTVAQLVAMTHHEIHAISGIGDLAIAEIETTMSAYGLSLRADGARQTRQISSWTGVPPLRWTSSD